MQHSTLQKLFDQERVIFDTWSYLNILFIINKQIRFLGKPRLIRLTVDPLNFWTILTN